MKRLLIALSLTVATAAHAKDLFQDTIDTLLYVSSVIAAEDLCGRESPTLNGLMASRTGKLAIARRTLPGW